MKNISILGSTGSIGTQTLDVIRNNPSEFKVAGLSANYNIDLIEKQIEEFQPLAVALMDKQKALELKKRIGKKTKTEILSGLDGIITIATLEETDLVVNSIVGMAGLIPTMQAIKKSKNIALANKETLVTAGEIVMAEAKKQGIQIIPVDSEHSAIFQCLKGHTVKDIERIILTASGGPFRGYSKEQLKHVSACDALKHPNWNMGKKITIDSATLMNKGLEIIEAKWLFDIDISQIDVVIHPQSIVHSLVEYKDHSIIAQMSYPDMRIPIQYALTYPIRKKNQYKKFNLPKIADLTFEEPDIDNFPCLNLAYEVIKKGGSLPAVLNAANEELVDYFLRGIIGFYDIPKFIELTLANHKISYEIDLHKILDADSWARDFIKRNLV